MTVETKPAHSGNSKAIWEKVSANSERLASLEGKMGILITLDVATFMAVLGLILSRAL